MSTEYTLTITALCPIDKLDAGNAIAAITGDGGIHDLRSFLRETHTGYSKAQLQAKGDFGKWLDTSLERPTWDTDNLVDVAGAQTLLNNAIILKEIPESITLDPTRMYIGVNCDPGSVLGLETIPDE